MKNCKKFSTKQAFLKIIKAYQRTGSPDHGFFYFWPSHYRCRFFPSCSEYTLRAIRQYGLLKGFVLSVHRILKCNPWSRGGYDPVV